MKESKIYLGLQLSYCGFYLRVGILINLSQIDLRNHLGASILFFRNQLSGEK